MKLFKVELARVGRSANRTASFGRAVGLILGAALGTGIVPVSAANLVVTSNADSGAGSLRATIASATAGDSISFAASLAGNTITVSSPLVINSAITIDAASAPSLTISGGSASQIFAVSTAGAVAINNVTLANGLAQGANGGEINSSSGGGGGGGAGAGGAIMLVSGSLTLSGDHLTGNQAVGGAGGSVNGNYPGVDGGAGGGPAGGTLGAGSTVSNGTDGGPGGYLSGGGGGGGTYGAFNSPAAGNGGTGGFGGGGGGAGGSPFGGGGATGSSGGTFGGNGADGFSSGSGAGGGGAGLGGAVFVQNGATLILMDTSVSNNSVQGGAAGLSFGTATGGQGVGSGFFLGGGTTTLTQSAGSSQTISDAIAEAPGFPSALTIGGAGTIILSGANSYTGGTTISSGIGQFGQTVSMPASGAVTVASGATLAVNAGGAGEFTNVTGGAGSIGGILNDGVGGQGAPVIMAAGSSIGIDTTNAGGSLAYNGDITNANIGLVKLGTGTLVLTGTNSYSGPTTIAAGALAAGSANALGTGDVSLLTGATLTTADAGNGVAVQIGGNYTQSSGSTLTLNVYGAANYDSVNLVTAGKTATLGGTLNLVFDTMNFTPNHNEQFTFFTTTGGINSPVSSLYLNPTTNLAALKLTATGAVTNGGDDFVVTVVPIQQNYALSALTRNQSAVATNLNIVINNVPAGGNYSSLIVALDQASSSPQTLASAFDQLLPVKLAAFASSTAFNNAGFTTQQFDSYLANHRGPDGGFVSSPGGFDYSGLVFNSAAIDPGLQMVHSRLLAWSPAPSAGLLSDSSAAPLGGLDMKAAPVDPAAMDRWNVFVTGNVVLAQNFSDAAAGLPYQSSTTGGVEVGADYKVMPHWLVGAAFGYGHTDADLDNNGSHATVNGYSPAVYTSYADQGWYANGVASYGFNNYRQQRNVSIAGFGGTANSSPGGDQILGDADGGYDFHRGNWTFGPTLGLQYVHLTVDGYTETGLPGADLAVNRDDSDSLRSRLGGQASYAVRSGRMIFTPHASASWQHEFLDQSRGLTSQFDGLGAGSFLVSTPSPSRDSALLEVGLDAQVDDMLTVFADYSAQAGQSNYFGQSVQAGIKIGF